MAEEIVGKCSSILRPQMRPVWGVWYATSQQSQQNVITVILDSNQLVNDLWMCSLYNFNSDMTYIFPQINTFPTTPCIGNWIWVRVGSPSCPKTMFYKISPQAHSFPDLTALVHSMSLTSSSTLGISPPQSLGTCCLFFSNASFFLTP